MSKLSNKVGRVNNCRDLARKLSFLSTKFDISLYTTTLCTYSIYLYEQISCCNVIMNHVDCFKNVMQKIHSCYKNILGVSRKKYRSIIGVIGWVFH